ncbi:MAG: dipeptidase [Ekhidna sp.]
MQSIIDFHCDLLSYLESVPNSSPYDSAIGCSITSMKEGNVALQVMAIYSATQKGSTASAFNQSLIFKKLLNEYESNFTLVKDEESLTSLDTSPKIGIIASIENASGICEEDQHLDTAFENLERIISNTERVLYIGLTHHMENRFGGGNYSEAGLKEDGKALLDYINGRKIAIDFSHTSDALAYGILDHVSKKGLDIPILASHSNYREVFDHPRNLPNELVKEIISRNGVIGVNLVRAFLNNEDPNALYDHINHGLKLGGEGSICFGADYFFPGTLSDPSRDPYYFSQHETSACYPSILETISEQNSLKISKKIGNENAVQFLKRVLI